MCAQLSSEKTCPYGAIECTRGDQPRIRYGCYEGLVVLDGQGNQVCNLEADLTRLNFYTLGNEPNVYVYDSSWTEAHYGYTRVLHYHSITSQETYYAVKSSLKGAAKSGTIIRSDGSTESWVYSCYNGYPS